MFLENESILDSLAYVYNKKNGDQIDIRIHNNDFCIIEDMLANLLEIDLTKLHSIISQLIEEEKISINQHIIYYAWYGSSNGKLYKLKTNKIDKYTENLKIPCLEDDRLKLVISSEAIKEIFKKVEFGESESFLQCAASSLENSRMFTYFVQGIICGVDDSIFKVNFGDQLKIVCMKMPNNNDFLKNYWLILDIFSFQSRFNKGIIKGKVNTIMSEVENHYLSEILDKHGKYSCNETNIKPIASKVNKIIDAFKIIRLVSKKTIWCSELVRPITSRAIGNNNILKLPDPYNYTEKDMNTLSDEDADKINKLLNVFSVIDDKIIEMALKNYDYSFFVPDDVAIVLLVTSLEVLFHPGDRDELKNRVARNAAVFLGNNNISSVKIFDDIRKFYDIRSKLVHSGVYNDKKSKIDVINDLRSIVSKAIIEYSCTVSLKDKKRKDFFKVLNESGFDSNPFSIE